LRNEINQGYLVEIYNQSFIFFYVLITILYTILYTNMNTKIVDILKRAKGKGTSITELVSKSSLPRSSVRISLAKLEGAREVSIRKVGMAKLYYLKKATKK